MAKRIKAGPLDESLIIQSFKDVDLLSNPTDAILHKEDKLASSSLEQAEKIPEEGNEVSAGQESGDAIIRSKPRRRKGNYDEIYLKRKEIKSRQPVYISQQLLQVITKLVHLLALSGKEISVGGYIDNVLADHLQQYQDEIEEICNQHSLKKIL